MLLSIIIPVYNIETYIRDCINSCINQNIDILEYEIIIVNDGSTDNSLHIAEEYSKSYKNIKIINKKNGGLSSARNAGLNVAEGKYVWFIDGDDKIKDRCIKDLLYYIQKYNLDILYLNYSRIYDTDIIDNNNSYVYNFKNKIFSGYEFFKNRQGDFLMVWRYIFKRSLLSNYKLQFYEGIIHEDVEFTHKAIYYADRIGICDSIIYHYRTARTGSIMTNKKANREIESILKIIQSIQEFRDNCVSDNLYKKLLDEYLLQIVANYIFYRKNLYNIAGYTDLLVIKKALKIKNKNITNTKKKIQLFAIKNCIITYSKVINLLYKK